MIERLLGRVGSEANGIFASGKVASRPFLSEHWSGEKDIPGVIIQFDTIINPMMEEILTSKELRNLGLEAQHWTPQSSGISIKPELVVKLESIWFEFLRKKGKLSQDFAAETDGVSRFIEGRSIRTAQKRYERNPFARLECIKYYGLKCSVCEMDFETCYGELGHDFIHVHHVEKISNIGIAHRVDPIEDLRPVCPNCHAMLHRKDPPITVDDLKALVQLNRANISG